MDAEGTAPDQMMLEVLSEQTLALSDGSIRPYQVVVLRRASGDKATEYGRYLSSDGARWVRHGLFQAFHPDGRLASQGRYSHGTETGHWEDFHASGQRAASGQYRDGREVGVWQYWSPLGEPEPPDDFGSI